MLSKTSRAIDVVVETFAKIIRNVSLKLVEFELFELVVVNVVSTNEMIVLHTFINDHSTL